MGPEKTYYKEANKPYQPQKKRGKMNIEQAEITKKLQTLIEDKSLNIKASHMEIDKRVYLIITFGLTPLLMFEISENMVIYEYDLRIRSIRSLSNYKNGLRVSPPETIASIINDLNKEI